MNQPTAQSPHRLRVLFLIEGWISPAPRYRVLQFVPFLEANGVEPIVRALHGRRRAPIYRIPGIGSVVKAIVRMRRMLQIRDAAAFDVVFLQRMTLPFSSMIERRLSKLNPNLVFDYDDAIYRTESAPSAMRMRVFQRVVASSKSVIAGSHALASASGRKTTVVPTVIDTDRVVPDRSSRDRLVIGWTGTHSNYVNFEPILAVLADILSANPGVDVEIIADEPPPFSLARMRFHRWNPRDETRQLQRFDIGIMPLLDTEWNRGKCAFKIVQYMAIGIPAVASPVGANADVVLDTETGFLVAGPEAWRDRLQCLIDQEALRLEMGRAGRKRCEIAYSVRSQHHVIERIIREAAVRSPESQDA